MGGLGVYRFYLCPEGLIHPDELPPRWCLLYANGRTIKVVVKPLGNLWPSVPGLDAGCSTSAGEWGQYQHAPDEQAERRALYSIARRLSAK
tara:strand:- start:1066 stop:1338 length:273 start_codon:yes stop_codon:yes gene_type:complete